jgi:heptaprenyl diphosphate synthase
MERAREHTFAVAREAQHALAELPDSEAKEALLALATGVVTRAG